MNMFESSKTESKIMKITELRASRGDHYIAVFDDESTIKVSTTLIADFSLYSGRELDDEEYENLVSAASLHSCKERALRIIGARPQSCGELYDKLVHKGESSENAAQCIAWLMDLKYLNDAQYALMIVRHYAAKGYGIQRVKNELYRRKIDKNLWYEALEEMPEMDDKVYDLLCKKLKSDNPDRAEVKKATDALYRRGFSWEEIKSAVNRFRGEYEE